MTISYLLSVSTQCSTAVVNGREDRSFISNLLVTLFLAPSYFTTYYMDFQLSVSLSIGLFNNFVFHVFLLILQEVTGTSVAAEISYSCCLLSDVTALTMNLDQNYSKRSAIVLHILFFFSLITVIFSYVHMYFISCMYLLIVTLNSSIKRQYFLLSFQFSLSDLFMVQHIFIPS